MVSGVYHLRLCLVASESVSWSSAVFEVVIGSHCRRGSVFHQLDEVANVTGTDCWSIGGCASVEESASPTNTTLPVALVVIENRTHLSPGPS